MWLLISRILAALLGGYACTWGVTSLGIAGLVFLDVDFHDAEAGMLMLAFLIFLGLFLWAFTVTSVIRVWSTLVGSAVVMTAAAWLLQRSVLS